MPHAVISLILSRRFHHRLTPETHNVAAMLHSKVVVVMLDHNEVYLPRCVAYTSVEDRVVGYGPLFLKTMTFLAVLATHYLPIAFISQRPLLSLVHLDIIFLTRLLARLFTNAHVPG